MMTMVQRGIAGVLALLGVTALLVIARFPIWWVLVSVIGVWLFAAILAWRVLYTWQRITFDSVYLMSATIFASAGLYTVVEWSVLRWLIIIIVALISSLLYGWEIDVQGFTTYIEKAYRRILTMFWVFNAYALVTTLFAIHIFFQEIPFWVLACMQGVIVGCITREIWHLYFEINTKKSWFLALLVMLMVTELAWVIHALPLGYTALGLLVTWMWYIVQLLFRFQLSESGVVWERQRWFLIVNIVILFIILSLVRWI